MKPTQLINGDRVVIKCECGDVEAMFCERKAVYKFAPRHWQNCFKTIKDQQSITLSNAQVIQRVRRA